MKITSELKTAQKRFAKLLSAKKGAEAKEAMQALISSLDKAASKGILHKNTASRKISRIMKALKKSETAQ